MADASIESRIDILTRGIVDVISRDELRDKLTRSRPLRVKAGFDPTSADLHLGHTIQVIPAFNLALAEGKKHVAGRGDFTN